MYRMGILLVKLNFHIPNICLVNTRYSVQDNVRRQMRVSPPHGSQIVTQIVRAKEILELCHDGPSQRQFFIVLYTNMQLHNFVITGTYFNI